MLYRPDLGFRDEGQELSSESFYADALGRFGEARVLPPVVFRSFRYSLLEDEMIWTRDWICIGTEDEIPREGDLLPFTVGIHGIHVQRVGQELKARFNKAQHGGCRAIPLQCQTGKKTKCSFTSCGYSRDRGAIPAGDLGEGAPEMEQYLGSQPERLLTAHTARLGPLIFVNLDVSPAAANLVFAEIAEAGGFFRGDTQCVASGTLEFPANWKILGQHLAAGEVLSENLDGEWLLVRATAGGKAALVAWLFPNLVLMRAGNGTCAVVLQPSALGQTICRYFMYGAVEEGNSAFWTAEIERRAVKACEDHKNIVRWGTNYRPETIGATLPVQQNLQGLWMQRMLAWRATRAPMQAIPQPIFQYARG
ncbi:ring-hydroxylating oxygenase subunit alpha [Hyphomicrobium sp. B1]|uniref:ring-hydroxylating oxygenase subunit alpha n=1 Tax=Hyphomicrobium sp. B1 TaxID=3075651 RepID=UPI003C2B4BA2